MDLLTLALGLLFGFFLTGYAFTRAIGEKPGVESCFIVSAMMLFQAIFWLAVLGIKISFPAVLGIVFALAAGLSLVAFKRKGACAEESPPQADDASMDGRLKYFLLFPAAAAVALIFLRSIFQPFNMSDAEFRWEHLALKILETGSLSYYPPFNPEDFKVYFAVDGIPPLISFIYYWLYASFGHQEQMATGLLVTMQFALVFYLCFRTASNIFESSSAGYFAVAALAASTLFFFSSVMGQETCMTSLSVIATFYFLTGNGKNRTNAMILAGFATALGAVSREYGCAFVLFGMLACFWRKEKPDKIIIYLLVVFMLAAPWYLRTWMRTGNPFYSISSLGGLFPTNPVHRGIFDAYVSYFGIMSEPLTKLYYFVSSLAFTAPLQAVVGVTAAFILGRKYAYLAISALVISLLWLYSVGQTSGGVFYSMRVLAPAIVIMSLYSGAILWKWADISLGKKLVPGILVAFGIFAFVQNLAVPFNVWKLGAGDIVQAGFTPMEFVGRRVFSYVEPLPDGAKVLSDSAFFHSALSASPERGIMLVPVWSPEFGFLFKDGDFKSSAEELKRHGVFYILNSKNSLNNNYLEKHRFFSEYRKHSKPVLEDTLCILYELP